MSASLLPYGDAEGPLGFPMPDRQARALDTLLKTLPSGDEYRYRHLVTAKAPTELNPGERSDVSWITTESVDRTGEVVMSRGMDDGQFRANPLVTLGHQYHLPPVGRSLWRRRVRDGARVGVKAKTQYPPRPESWPAADAWPPDQALALVQAGLLNGKSIGFLPTRVHIPDEAEVQKNGWGERVTLVIDEWLLLEYACVFLPANQDALVEAVTKGAVELSAELAAALGLTWPLPRAAERAMPFTPLEEIEEAVRRRVEAVDFEALARRAVADALDRARGRV
jgi:hypothetical protein